MTAGNTSGLADPFHSKLVGSIDYPTAAVASYLVSPRTLVRVRLVFFLFMLSVGITSLVDWFSIQRGFALDLMYFAFFTNCNLWGLIFYLGFTLSITRRAFQLGFASDKVISRPAAIVHSLLYTWNCAYHPLVVLVYWLFLSGRFFTVADGLEQFISVSSHGITFVVVLFEVVLGGMSMNPWAVVPVVLLLCLYTAWAVVYHAIGNVWVYGFLDPTKPAAAYFYPGILVASIIFFALMVMVHRLRSFLLSGRTLILPANAANKSVA